MNPDQIKTLIEQAKALSEQLAADPTQVGDEQLSEIRERFQAARQEILAGGDEAKRNPANLELLRQIADTRTAVIAEQEARVEAARQIDEEASRLLADLEDPEPVAEAPDGDKDDDEPAGQDAPAAEAEAVEEVREPALAASAGADVQRLTAQVGGLVKVLSQGLTAAAKPAPAEDTKPAGRSAGRIGTTAVPTTPQGDVVVGRTYAGSDASGAPISSSYALAKRLHDTFRTVYPESTGRIPIAHVALEYPESRRLGPGDAPGNFAKLEALTSPEALVAAGGLCAPLTPNYDVEVIGTSARPIKEQAMQGVQVERGGLSFRPPISSAAAVNGAGQWTLENDEAASVVNNTGPTKRCYEVDCPGMEEEFIWAAYLCLEFSNITSRFDPETTTANIRSGEIAHARLAENLLLSKMAAESVLLTGSRVIGATRDLLVNVDKASAGMRSRHRIDSTLPLTWVAPFWVRHLIRADLARQMASGDFKDALGVADSEIDAWFSRRGVTPVWHMDGIAGTDEVQTVTITGSPTGGSFTLTYAGDTTAAIAYNATAAEVASALAGLDTLDAEDITVTGGPGPGTPYVVTFGGSDSTGVNVPQMSATGSFTGGTAPAVSVATTTGGDGAITVNGVTIPSQTFEPVAAGTAIQGFPDKIDSLLYPTGSWAFLDGGSLDLGLVRDHTLNAKNRYRQFQETFEGAAFRGVESLRLVMEVQPTGQTAGTKDLDAIAD